MSNSIVYGLAPYDIVPCPDFEAGADSLGAWTGSQTFTCRKFDFSAPQVQQRLQPGTRITSLYTALGPEWDFLIVDNYRHEHQPGGMTKIFVNFIGTQNSGGYTQIDRDVSVSLNGTMMERSLLKHPKFVALTNAYQKPLSALLNGTGVRSAWSTDDPITVVSTNPFAQEEIGAISGDAALKFYKEMITNGNLTYEASSLEWTVSKSNSGGITDEDLSALSYIDTPEMSPPVISGRNWRLVSANQNKARSAEGTVKTWSKTWLMSPPGEEWDEFFYGKP